jgi:hypothetical protein
VRHRSPERGQVTDEYLRASKTLWTQDDPRFEGRYARFADISFLPTPVQSRTRSLWVVAASWLPGRGAPPHDHGTCAIIVGVDGNASVRSHRG